MSGKKLLPLLIILGIMLALPAHALAEPNFDKQVATEITSVAVDDYNSDGFESDALVQGTVTLTSNGTPENLRCVIVFYLTYLPDGSYSGPMNYGDSWVLSKAYGGFQSGPGGYVNGFEFNIDNLPYPGWYRITAAAIVRGQTGLSEPVIFDPIGGGSPGPIGR
jgi:hypothetical protein